MNNYLVCLGPYEKYLEHYDLSFVEGHISIPGPQQVPRIPLSEMLFSIVLLRMTATVIGSCVPIIYLFLFKISKMSVYVFIQCHKTGHFLMCCLFCDTVLRNVASTLTTLHPFFMMHCHLLPLLAARIM